MFKPYADWMQDLSDCPGYLPHRMGFHARPVHELCVKRTSIPSLTGNDLALNSNTADALRSVAADIRHATESVNMVFYIWHPGGHADDVAKAVCDAARRGVTVRIMLDSAGSKEFFRSHWPAAMRNAGVHLVESLAVTPFRMFFRRQDIRQHRKIVVIDNAIGYTGSMNMVDPRFFKQDSGVGQWVDVMVRITGPVVPLLNSILCWDWEVETGNRNLPPHNCVVPEGHKHLTHAVQVVPSGPSMPDGLIQQVLHLAIHQAQRSVTITTPYLVPGDYLLETLKTTAYRGIDVSIIIPAKNDSLMVEWASRAFFSDLLEAGVKIYRFGGGLLHTKSVMIDDDYCLIGTVNMDMRSFWLNFELTLLWMTRNFVLILSACKNPTSTSPPWWISISGKAARFTTSLLNSSFICSAAALTRH